MRSNRLLTVAIVVGVVISAVSFLCAAKFTGDDSPGKDNGTTPGQAKNSGRGVVVYAIGDLESGVSQLPLLPESLFQPIKVTRVLHKEGDEVKKGEPILELDTVLADLSIDEAKAGLANAEEKLKEAEAGVKAADDKMNGHGYLVSATESTIESKERLLESAQIDLQDKQSKADKLQFSNDAELAMAKKKYASALSDLNSEKKKLEGLKRIQPTAAREQAQAQVGQAVAGVDLQKAVLKKAQHGLKLMILKAPVDGTIVRSFVIDGMSFGAQSKVPPLILQPKGTIIVRAEVDQEWASRVAKGQDAIIQDDGNSSLKWSGKVIRVADSFMPKRSNASLPEGFALNETRVLECIISVENYTGADVTPKPVIRVGQRFKVSIGVE